MSSALGDHHGHATVLAFLDRAAELARFSTQLIHRRIDVMAGPVKFDAKNVQMQCHNAVMRQPACPRQRIMTSLNRRFRSAQAFTVEPRAVEAARASLSGGEH